MCPAYAPSIVKKTDKNQEEKLMFLRTIQHTQLMRFAWCEIVTYFSEQNKKKHQKPYAKNVLCYALKSQ